MNAIEMAGQDVYAELCPDIENDSSSSCGSGCGTFPWTLPRRNLCCVFLRCAFKGHDFHLLVVISSLKLSSVSRC